MKVIIGKVDNSIASFEVVGYKRSLGLLNPRNFLISCLTFYEDGYQYTYNYKHGLSDGRRCLYVKNEDIFPMGLVPHVYKILKKQYGNAIEIDISQVQSDFKASIKFTQEDVIAYAKRLVMPYTPYDYQIDMVTTSLNKKRRALSACTGAGKSLVIYILGRYLLEEKNKDVLIIVPSMSLVEQIYSDFIGYGWNELDIKEKCSRLHSQVEGKLTKKQIEELAKYEITPDHLLKRMVISTWQSLQNKPENFYRRFGAVIVDEAHGAQADVLSNIVYNCTFAEYKIGLSGTIPDEGLSAHVITGCLGPTDIIVRTKDLIERGILTPTEIHAIKIPFDTESCRAVKKMKYAEEVDATSSCGAAEKALRLLLGKGKITSNQNTIMLVKNITLLNDIYDLIENEFPEFTPIKYYGNVSAKKREEVRVETENGEGKFLICTYGTMKQGVNIKKVHNIIFGQGSSSFVTVKQSIGRGLRRHKDKNVLRVFDLVMDLSSVKRTGSLFKNYAMKHFDERLDFYIQDEYPIYEVTLPVMASFRDIKLD